MAAEGATGATGSSRLHGIECINLKVRGIQLLPIDSELLPIEAVTY